MSMSKVGDSAAQFDGVADIRFCHKFRRKTGWGLCVRKYSVKQHSGGIFDKFLNDGCHRRVSTLSTVVEVEVVFSFSAVMSVGQTSPHLS